MRAKIRTALGQWRSDGELRHIPAAACDAITEAVLAAAFAPTVPSQEAMDQSRRISGECWDELRGWIIASHPGYGLPGTRVPMGGPEAWLSYVDELRARISKPISDELIALGAEFMPAGGWPRVRCICDGLTTGQQYPNPDCPVHHLSATNRREGTDHV